MFDTVFQWQFWVGVLTGTMVSVGLGLVMVSKLCSGDCESCKYLHSNPVISAQYAKTMEALLNEKDSAVKAARFPVQGLGFDDNGVTFNGIPFSQCSSAEKLRVSVAIAMAMNPTLKILRVSDGSLLDMESRKLLCDMVAAKDYQLWMEVVDDSGKLGVYIEDGGVNGGVKC